MARKRDLGNTVVVNSDQPRAHHFISALPRRVAHPQRDVCSVDAEELEAVRDASKRDHGAEVGLAIAVPDPRQALFLNRDLHLAIDHNGARQAVTEVHADDDATHLNRLGGRIVTSRFRRSAAHAGAPMRTPPWG